MPDSAVMCLTQRVTLGVHILPASAVLSTSWGFGSRIRGRGALCVAQGALQQAGSCIMLGRDGRHDAQELEAEEANDGPGTDAQARSPHSGR